MAPRSLPIARTAFSPARPKAARKDDSRKQLEESLRLLKTDHVDLYQFHALTKMTELDTGAWPRRRHGDHGSREEGRQDPLHRLLRALGGDRAGGHRPLQLRHRALSRELGAFTQANFGPQILKRAQEKQMGILALKGHGEDGMAA